MIGDEAAATGGGGPPGEQSHAWYGAGSSAPPPASRLTGEGADAPGSPTQAPSSGDPGSAPGHGLTTSAGPSTTSAPGALWDGPTSGAGAIVVNGDDAKLLRRTRLRLVAWSGGITLGVLLLLGATLFMAVRTSLESDSVAQLQQRAETVARVLGRIPSDMDPSGSPELRPAFGGVNSGTIWLIIRPDGVIVANQPAMARDLGLPESAGVSAARAGKSLDIHSAVVAGVPVRVLTEPVQINGSTFVVQVVGDTTAESQTLGALLRMLVICGLLALAFAIGGGWLYAERALVPIRESLRRQREFTADASHELRTPLAVIRGNLEYMSRHPEATVADLRPAVDDMTAEVDELTRLVDDLLLLARADSGSVEVAHEPIDLADVATTALGALAPVAEERGIRLHLDAQPAQVTGDPGRLRQVVTILVDNAIRHSPPGGGVFVGVAPVGREALLRVDDEGPGIREEDRPHLFERFWRAADAPPGGVGLGLSIGAWIVGRHGGTIDGATRPDGRGARFEVKLPLAS